MGAMLVCFGAYEPDLSDIRQRLLNGDSLLDRFQKAWSCGRLDDCDDSNAFLLQSDETTASSGSRLLSAFYSRLVEENDDCAFYIDSRGIRLREAYLDQVEVLENYFMPVDHKRILSKAFGSSLIQSLESYSCSEDCLSTTSTMTSEFDNWLSVDWSYECNLHSRPFSERCLSLNSVNSAKKLHRSYTGLHKQEDSCLSNYRPVWNTSRSKLAQVSPLPPFGEHTIAAS
ncbi:uncharacterized protein PHALS_12533 [Plasmopara halstedii]|uniref:Uncharacterized protein n=1 Tax=Plasmopara halstedii TaxID=4781 RepID=A0A0P1AM63_PLAHL|nr:uncharacterized protein PHALS_12533 [Plasmopara halstedii]CEG42240.1 hypothetical protein PHALS_12533 [Plasmopara halstedii]|eukprot:XP_024578609.1 hypothetical protein PHALS_12533 [Plasmopara halstedii]